MLELYGVPLGVFLMLWAMRQRHVKCPQMVQMASNLGRTDLANLHQRTKRDFLVIALVGGGLAVVSIGVWSLKFFGIA